MIWNRIEYYNLIFAVFHLWPLQLLINNPVFYYNICRFSTERQIQSKWNILSYDHRSILEKYIIIRNDWIVWQNPHEPAKPEVDMDFRSHPNRVAPWYYEKWIPWPLSRTVSEIFDFTFFRVWPWPLTFRGHLGSKIFSQFESPCMTSYLTSIDTFSLSRTIFEIFDFKVFRVWPWPLTFGGHLRSKIFSPFESPYMTSYLTSIDIFSLSRTVFEIFDFEIFRVWPWPLTFKGHLGSKIFSPFESPNMTSYLTSIDTFSLSRTIFEIFDFEVIRV